MEPFGGRGSPEPRSGETARLLILVGLIVQFVGVLVILIIGAVIVGGFPQFPPFFAAIFGVLGVVGIVWLILVYMFSYRTTSDRDYTGARTPTLVIGILSLVTGSVISGVLYLIAYVKLGDAIEEISRAARGPWGDRPSARYVSPPPVGGPAPPPGTRFCPACGTPATPDQRFCTRCASPLIP